MGEKRNACKVFGGGGELNKRDHSEDLGIERMIILKCIK